MNTFWTWIVSGSGVAVAVAVKFRIWTFLASAWRVWQDAQRQRRDDNALAREAALTQRETRASAAEQKLYDQLEVRFGQYERDVRDLRGEVVEWRQRERDCQGELDGLQMKVEDMTTELRNLRDVLAAIDRLCPSCPNRTGYA